MSVLKHSKIVNIVQIDLVLLSITLNIYFSVGVERQHGNESFKVNNKYITAMCETCSKLLI